jgi:hypothetical protein
MQTENDLIASENEIVKRTFNLQEVLEFTNRHEVQLVCQADYSYTIFIDKQGGFGNALTPMFALWSGIQQKLKKLQA